MRLILAAVGRLKDGPDRQLFERYWSRLEAGGRQVGLSPVTVTEIPEGRAAGAAARRDDEAARLLKLAGDADLVVALDERGRQMSSETFATFLGGRRDDGVKSAALLIGGPDGHGAAVLEAAAMTLSLSAMTLPHGLARVMLAEQIYRAITILSGHPYHRA